MLYGQENGLISAVSAFAIWGLFPLYWKLFGYLGAQEVVAYRIWWCFIFMLVLIYLLGMVKNVKEDFKQLLKTRKKLLLVIAGSTLISFNWGIYIWAVNDNRIIESSLGYYINPLVNVLIGIVFLSERLTRWQILSICLATAGVLNMAINLGTVPWVSLLLALTMGFYALCKKLAHLNVFTSMTIETALIMPFALAYIIYLNIQQPHFTGNITSYLLLASTGMVTAIPLLLFANAANKLPMNIIGFAQYVSPTIAFLIGVFVYKEPFTDTHLVSFGLIWLALLLFTLANTGILQGAKEKKVN